ncbi:MAG: long-chain fatty acid--CoA ligase [Candidatus Marinimicrobia bacterium]|nr:long-chain fatty acid--CoA ligase [Candidatus Neomarinimicrobiota bacterium]
MKSNYYTNKKWEIDYLETIPILFNDAVEKNKKLVAFYDKKGGEWIGTTYQEVRDKVEKVAFGLEKLGYKYADKIGILSENRSEWTITDYACAHFGFVTAPIYSTLIPKQIEYILNNSESKIVFVSTHEQAEKIIVIKKNLSHLKKMVIFDDHIHYPQDWIINFSELLKIGAKHIDEVKYSLEDVGKKRKKDDLWTLIYTSGTTGDPKGVMLTHFNIATNIQAITVALNFQQGKRFLSFLPLSHSAERMGSHLTFWLGSTTYFAESMEKIAENLKYAKPNHIATVPRLFEKIYAKILDGVTQSSPIKQKIFFWAKSVGSEVSKKYIQKGKEPTGTLKIKYGIAKKLVFNKITDAVGGEFEFGVCGGAPLPKFIGEFFASAGVKLIEVFGLSETTPIATVNKLDNIKFGKVGTTLPDVQMKLAKDGEILFKGPNIMKGYYKNPKATKEAFDKDGWFFTGDIGLIDEDKYLKITDRKKNIIVTSGGKNIAPANIEQQLSKSRLIDQLIVIGDKRNFLIAIVVPVQEKIEKLASTHKISFNNYEELLNNHLIYELVKNDIDKYQTELSKYEQIKKFILKKDPFSIENGDLTPSIKIKRKVVEERFNNEIELLYE